MAKPINCCCLGEWQPSTEVPNLERDGLSREVLISSHCGYYVGYTDGEDWFESYNGDKVGHQFQPKSWAFIIKGR